MPRFTSESAFFRSLGIESTEALANTEFDVAEALAVSNEPPQLSQEYAYDEVEGCLGGSPHWVSDDNNTETTPKHSPGNAEGIRREGIDPFAWFRTISSLRGGNKVFQQRMLASITKTMEGTTEEFERLKVLTEITHGLQVRSCEAEVTLHEHALPLKRIQLSSAAEHQGLHYRATIDMFMPELSHYCQAMFAEYVLNDLGPLAVNQAPAVCSTIASFDSSPYYQSRFIERLQCAKAVAENNDQAAVMLFGVFQDSAVVNSNGRTVNPIKLILVTCDRAGRRSPIYTEVLAGVIPPTKKCTITKAYATSSTGASSTTDTTIDFESCHDDVQRVFNREITMDALRKVARELEQTTFRVVLPDRRSFAVATGVLHFILDCPAKTLMNGVFNNCCFVCEDARRLPRVPAMRDPQRTKRIRFACSDPEVGAEVRAARVKRAGDTLGLHISASPLANLLEDDGQTQTLAIELMHLFDNTVQAAIFLVTLAAAGQKQVHKNKDGQVLELRLDMDKGQFYFFNPATGESLLPSKSKKQNFGGVTKQSILAKAQREPNVIGLFGRARVLGGQNTNYTIDKTDKMVPRNRGFDGIILAAMTRDPASGLLSYFSDQKLGLLCVQLLVLIRHLATLARDPAAGILHPRLEKAQSVLRSHWLKVHLLLGLPDISVSVHIFIQHIPQGVQMFGSLAKVDSEARETGHKVTKAIARCKTNLQNTKREGGVVVASGEQFNEQIVRNSVDTFFNCCWVRHFLMEKSLAECDTSKDDLEDAQNLQPKWIGAPRAPITYFSLSKSRWDVSRSTKAITAIFGTNVVLPSLPDENGLIFGSLAVRVLDALRQRPGSSNQPKHQRSRMSHLYEAAGIDQKGLMEPPVRIAAIEQVQELHVLSWWNAGTPELQATDDSMCFRADCLGCRRGWNCSTERAHEEFYGLPLGFAKIGHDEVAIICKLKLESFEPALQGFMLGSDLINLSPILGQHCFDVEPTALLVPARWLRGKTKMILDVTSGGGHFVLYRRFESVEY